MKPPFCSICDKPVEPNSDSLLQFKLSPEDIESKKRFQQKGFIGHPMGLEWLCPKHLRIAKKYTDRTWAEARPRIILDSWFGRLTQWWKR